MHERWFFCSDPIARRPIIPRSIKLDLQSWAISLFSPARTPYARTLQIACSTIRNLSQKYISSDSLNGMDTFNFPPLSPASSTAFPFDQQPPFQPFIQPTPVEEDIANVPESHQNLKKKWESLKPLIQRVYIEENKPFPYLARILHDEYEFTPT